MTNHVNYPALGLHEGANNTLCRCGQCAHRLRLLAARLDITVEQLRDTLKASSPKATPPPVRTRRPHGGLVAERVTVTTGGVQHTGTDAILATVRALT